jgi:hypothetical protein
MDAGVLYVVEGGITEARRGTIEVSQIGVTVPGVQLYGTEAGERAGASVASVCDVDGDGDLDFAVGTPGLDAQAETDAGSVALVLDTEPAAPGACGPAGCSVVHLATGAQLDVPVGSLATTMTLGTTGILDPLLLPAVSPAGDALLGAAEFKPDGQTFGMPDPTVRVPIRPTYDTQVTNGESFRLFRFDGLGWTDSGIDALVGGNLQYPTRNALVADLGTLRYYAAFIPDLDGDGLRDSLDPDRDGDGIANGSDCAPDDPANPVPGEAGSMSVGSGVANSTLLSWAAVPGAATYDVARGSFSGMQSSGDLTGAIGLSCAQATTNYEDVNLPPAGDGYYYLIRAESLCGKGTWGEDSGQMARGLTACP